MAWTWSELKEHIDSTLINVGEVGDFEVLINLYDGSVPIDYVGTIDADQKTITLEAEG